MSLILSNERALRFGLYFIHRMGVYSGSPGLGITSKGDGVLLEGHRGSVSLMTEMQG